MNLAEKLNEKSTAVENASEIVSKEILDYFKEWFESGNAEKYIEGITRTDNIVKRQLKVPLEFWQYSSGCSNTCYRISGKSWTNGKTGHESNEYKGVCLYDLQKTLGPKLLNLAEYHFKDMGFRVEVENHECWLGYYSKILTLKW